VTERINGKLLHRALAAARARGEIDWGVSEEAYQFWKEFWKGGAGNAKARRRWRRRNVPNTQKLRHAEDVIWRERVEPMQRVPPVALGPDSPSLVGAMRYMTEALRGAR
jgi:hypothetical protein